MIVLIDNYDSFTYNLFQYLTQLTPEVRVFRNDRITLSEIETMHPAGIVISPGPGRPEDAAVSVDIVRDLAGQLPILGVCLGHQAIGYVNGGRIVGAPTIMHGKISSVEHDGRGVFHGLPSPFVATRYHSLVIDTAEFPEAELEISARTADGVIMGVRHKKHSNLEGVQFHPESILTDHGMRLMRNFVRLCGLPLTDPIESSVACASEST